MPAAASGSWRSNASCTSGRILGLGRSPWRASTARWRSTNAAAARGRPTVSTATARARQDWSTPRWTRSHSRGRRKQSSSASPTSWRPLWNEMSRAAASSTTDASVTCGVPSPASGAGADPVRSRSGTQEAAGCSTGSTTGCRSAQCTTNDNRSASAASAARRRSTTPARVAAAPRSRTSWTRRSVTSAGVPAAVSSMPQHPSEHRQSGPGRLVRAGPGGAGNARARRARLS